MASGMGKAPRFNGYQGFKCNAAQPCPTLKPGETYDSRAKKFSKIAATQILPSKASENRLGSAAFDSIAAQGGSRVTPNHYHVPDKRGVQANEPMPTTRPFIARSIHMQDYAQHATEFKQLLQSVPLQDYQQAFESLADEQHHFINNSQVTDVLTRAFQYRPVPGLRQLAEVLASFFNRHGDPHAITWDKFHQAIDAANDFFDHQTNPTPMSTLRLAEENDSRKQRILPATTPSSSHQADFGCYGDNPIERGYMRKRSMLSTTSDLNPGTTRDTFHLPGYTGFLPRTTHNPQAVNQADGEQARETVQNLRLYYHNDVPGYTGHRPDDCNNARGECKAGCDPRTTNGAFFRSHHN